jgi:hypothetical protein
MPAAAVRRRRLLGNDAFKAELANTLKHAPAIGLQRLDLEQDAWPAAQHLPELCLAL